MGLLMSDLISSPKVSKMGLEQLQIN